MGKKTFFCFVLVCLFIPSLQAEYRAYWLEIYDVLDKTKSESVTGNWDPYNYSVNHGGYQRTRAIMKATWMCHGPTTANEVCPMPTALDPKFKVGQKITVALNKHTTYLWTGKIEVVLWREEYNCNVYGVRFFDQGVFYSTYFEGDLIDFGSPSVAK